MRVAFPFPPSTNNLYFNAAGRGRVRTKKYEVWCITAKLAIYEQRPDPVAGKVALSIRLSKPDKRRRDLSNHIKAIEDLLVDMRLIDDDRNVERIDIAWGDETIIEVVPA